VGYHNPFQAEKTMSDLDEQAQFFVQKGVRTVLVNGEAEISTEPDFITVTLGVKEQNDDLELARAATLKGIQRVLEVAKAFQFPVEDVQTQMLSSEKVEEIVGEDGIALHGFGESELTSKRRKNEYFIVSLDVMLVVHGPRIGQNDAVMQALLGTGAAIDGESMETTRLGDLRQEARILAVANAKRKAESLTTGTGMTVPPPIIIREFGRESTGGQGAPGADGDASNPAFCAQCGHGRGERGGEDDRGRYHAQYFPARVD
jgi:hypothetical protein